MPAAAWLPRVTVASDRGEVPLALRAGLPMLDDRQEEPPPSRPTVCVWSGVWNGERAGAPSRDLSGSDEVPPYAAAAGSRDLSGAPPTCVVVGAMTASVTRTSRTPNAAACPASRVIAGLPHAYLLVPGAVAVQLAMHCMDNWLSRAGRAALGWNPGTEPRRLSRARPDSLASWTNDAASSISNRKMAPTVAAAVARGTCSVAAGGPARQQGHRSW